MLTSTEFLFWSCLTLGLYPYLGYPLGVALLRALRARPVRSQPITPSVTVVISAYNEASHIEATVRNKLTQDYAGPLDVMVASDGSTDGTDQVLRQLAQADSRVSFFRQEPAAVRPPPSISWSSARAARSSCSRTPIPCTAQTRFASWWRSSRMPRSAM